MTPLQQAAKMCETLTEGIKARDEQIEGLKLLLKQIKRDLLLRSDTDCDGCDVVNLSASLWLELKEVTSDI